MSFIEITNNVCVNVSQISWVEKMDEGLSCVVCIGDKEYPSDIPYQSFIGILKNSESAHDNYHFAG